MTTPEIPRQQSDGGVAVSELALAKLAGKAARTTYGVVGMHGSPVQRVAGLFRGSLAEGVHVELGESGQVNIRLSVVMERGVNVAQVTATLREQVRYEVERNSGLTVGDIEVRVEDLRE